MQKVESNLAPMLPPKAPTDPTDPTDPSFSSEREALGDLLIDVSLPQVIEDYVTEKMLVMTYIDGFKVTSHWISSAHP